MAKTKQEFMKAVFTAEKSNARNMSDSKQLISRYVLTDKKTEREIVDCRLYMSASRNASTVYASLWVLLSEKKKPEGWKYCSTSGGGSAGGYGYDKKSAAVADAISSAGIELYGSPYARPVNGDSEAATKALLKKRAHIGGCGEGSIRAALCAIAYAAGFTDCVITD